MKLEIIKIDLLKYSIKIIFYLYNKYWVDIWWQISKFYFFHSIFFAE